MIIRSITTSSGKIYKSFSQIKEEINQIQFRKKRDLFHYAVCKLEKKIHGYHVENISFITADVEPAWFRNASDPEIVKCHKY